MSALFVYKLIFISQASFGDQEIHYNQNNHNEFYFMKTWMIFFGAQEDQSNNKKGDEFANHTFFRDALYIYNLKLKVLS